VTRWLAFALALVVAAAALYLLVSGGPGGRPMADIDRESRQQLEQVLREADREETRR
jgi:hypothetical protein